MTATARSSVQCPTCKANLLSGEIIKGVSIIRLIPSGSEGMCKRCKTWVRLPIGYAQKSQTIKEALDNSLLMSPRKLAQAT